MPFEQIGNGTQACLAIPGWGEDRSCFRPLAELLEHRATLYAVDPPGYGDNPLPGDLNWETVTNGMLAIHERASREADREINCLIGNCSGAMLACEMALRMGRPPRRMLLIDPFAFLPPYFRIFLKPGFGRQAYNSTFANPVGRWLTNRLAKGRADSGTDMTSSFRCVDHDLTYRYLELFATHAGIGQYARLDCETVIVTGAESFAAVRKSVQMWQELWPHARVVILENCGHLPIREAPGELINALFTSGVEARL